MRNYSQSGWSPMPIGCTSRITRIGRPMEHRSAQPPLSLRERLRISFPRPSHGLAREKRFLKKSQRNQPARDDNCPTTARPGLTSQRRFVRKIFASSLTLGSLCRNSKLYTHPTRTYKVAFFEKQAMYGNVNLQIPNFAHCSSMCVLKFSI